MTKAQEVQNKIHRKLTADQKVWMVNDFIQFSRKLQKAKDSKQNDSTKISQSDQRCSKRS